MRFLYSITHIFPPCILKSSDGFMMTAFTGNGTLFLSFQQPALFIAAGIGYNRRVMQLWIFGHSGSQKSESAISKRRALNL